MTEANMGNMLSECLSEVYTCIYIKPGEYNGSANFEIKLDVNNGVYVEDFMAGFKREGSLGAWDMVGGEDTYFEKIK